MTTPRVNLTGGTSKGLLLDLIRSHGPISRVGLIDRTGLTQPTVSAAVRGLLDEGLVRETGRGASTGGKPPTMLEVDPRARYAVGMQIGSESSSFVAIDLAGGVVGRIRTAGVGASTPADAAADLAAEIEDLLAALGIERTKVIGVGVAAPGPLDLERGTVLGSPQIAQWVDVPIRQILSREFDLPVLLDNDATAAAVGDFWSGALEDSHAHATVYAGDGIGSGILLDGTVFRGASSNSGELGQIVLAVDGDRYETVQLLAAPAAVVARAAADGDLRERYGLDAQDTFAAFTRLATGAAHGDEAAQAHIVRSAELLAIGVVNLATLFDLDSISLAGPAFEVAGATYVQVVAQALEQRFFARGRHPVRVRLSPQLGETAAIGAAALVLQTFLSPRMMGLAPPTPVG